MLDSKLLTDLRPRLLPYILKRVRDVHLAEDLLQDVLMKLYVHGAHLPQDDERRVLAWALRTAHNAVVDHFRKSRAGDQSLELIAEPAADDVNDRTSPPSLAGCARSMVGRLPERYRRAVELADLRQRPQHEVAQQLGISLSGAKSRVQRGRQQLRAMIGECCDVELGRRGSVVSVVPTSRARAYCGPVSESEQSCVQSRDAASI